MQEKQRNYGIEYGKNPLTKKIPQRKPIEVKILTDQAELKWASISISKAMVKQFQRQPKKIQESDEK